MWTDNSGNDVDVHGQEHFHDYEVDEEGKENTAPAGDHDGDDNQPQCLRRRNGVPFQRVESITDSVIRSLFQICLQMFFHYQTILLISLNLYCSVFLNSTFRNCFFSFLKMCLLNRVVCISLVLVLVSAFSISTIVMYEVNRVLVLNVTNMSSTCQTLRKEEYYEY